MTEATDEAVEPGSRSRRRDRLPFAVMGPAFVAAVAYVDPGNIATNTAAGAGHGFLLLWVVVLATLMAGPVQYLSAKLGLVSGRSLPEYVAAHTSRPIRLAYWAQAELVAIATDIAEIIGAAVAMNLLWGVPLVPAGLIAGAAGMLILLLRDHFGSRFFEGMCLLALVAIGAGFVVGILHRTPSLADMAGGLVPGFDGTGTVLLAAGIVGATVMPHAVYLHSGLTAGDRSSPTPREAADVGRRLAWTRWDVGVAMVFAGGINVSMLVLGASVLRGSGSSSLDETAAELASRVGSGATTAFLVALLVSGLSSTAVGTQAGAMIMSGLLRRQVPVLLRRVVVLVPALALLASGQQPLTVLVLSQVALAIGLPFALIPLIVATHSETWMGPWRSPVVTRVVAGVIAAAVIALDLALVVLTLTGHG